MAAGDARRFGSNKLTAPVDGKSMIRRALDAVPADRLEAVCVVTQYDQVEALAGEYGFLCVRNDRPDLGLSRTVRLGTEALADRCGAVMFLVADQPLLRRESVEGLLDCYLDHPDRIVSAAHGGVRGNPCVFPARFFPELCALEGDVGGSAVIRRHGDALLLRETEEEQLTDVDTPEALEQLRK
jgi:molybdenum cofactor cytidylyltransferase